MELPEIVFVGTDQLEPNPWNPNVMSPEMLDHERNSITRFGFIVPIVARKVFGREKLEIVDGEHRHKVAVELGLHPVPVVVIGDVPDEVAKQLTLALNEIKGRPDSQKLAALLADLTAKVGIDPLTELLPYSETDINDLVATVSTDLEELGKIPVQAHERTKTSETVRKVVFELLETEAEWLEGRLKEKGGSSSEALMSLLGYTPPAPAGE